jgi:DNA-binding MarR family transcriptional regulator
MQETSLESFKSIRQSLGKRQEEVIKALKELGYATNTMIARHLDLPINCVTGRTRELSKRNLVLESHTSWCPITKNRAIYWKLNEKEDILHE